MPDASIDAATLAELLETVGGDREFLVELVETYLADSPNLLAELRAAVAAETRRSPGGPPTRSSRRARAFGALGLAAQCREIEAAAAGGDLDGARRARGPGRGDRTTRSRPPSARP